MHSEHAIKDSVGTIPTIHRKCNWAGEVGGTVVAGSVSMLNEHVCPLGVFPEGLLESILALIMKASTIIGIDLATVIDLEIAHINISVKSDVNKREETRAAAEGVNGEADEATAGCPLG